MTAAVIKTLAAKLAEVLEAVGYIPKNGTNTTQNYKFVTDADVLDTVRTALAARKVATAVSVTTLHHEPYTTAKGSPQFLATVEGVLTFLDGESDTRLDIPFVGAGADSGDKGAYKAITGGVKYALLKTFLIPTGDDPENDEKPATRDTVTVAPKVQPPAVLAPQIVPTPAVAPSGTEPQSAPDKPATGLTSAQQGKYRAWLREQGLNGDQARLFGSTLTGKWTTKDMTQADYDILVAIMADSTDAKGYLDFVKGAQSVPAEKAA